MGISMPNILFDIVIAKIITMNIIHGIDFDFSQFGVSFACKLSFFDNHSVGIITVFMGQIQPQNTLPNNNAISKVTPNIPNHMTMAPFVTIKINIPRNIILVKLMKTFII